MSTSRGGSVTGWQYKDGKRGVRAQISAPLDLLKKENANARTRLGGLPNAMVGTGAGLDFFASENVQTWAQETRFCASTNANRCAPKTNFLPVGNYLRKSSFNFLPVGNWARFHLTLFIWLLYDVRVMSDVFTNRMEPGRAQAASDRVIRRLEDGVNHRENEPPDPAISGEPMGAVTERSPGQVNSGPPDQPAPLRIHIDVPMGTSYQEIQESIFRQAYQHAGTQLRAAIALGITPDTVSRVMRRFERRKSACPTVPEVWPVVMPPEPTPQVNRVMGPAGIDDFGLPIAERKPIESQPSSIDQGTADEPIQSEPEPDTDD